MDSLNKLTELFRQFPGIGPRQAKRFVYFLLSQTGAYRDLLSKNIYELGSAIDICKSCFRYFPKGKITDHECPICKDPKRESASMLVVSRDVDYENIEKSREYNGKYFVLGGNIPILDKEPESKVRARELYKIVHDRVKTGELKEIILALNLTPEGENTEDFLRKYLATLSEKHGIKISKLGRGLSTGLELEYSDTETIKNALKNRK